MATEPLATLGSPPFPVDLTLVCRDGARLSAHRYILAWASPVLREALGLPLGLPSPSASAGCLGSCHGALSSAAEACSVGELAVDDDGPDWEVALLLVAPTDYTMRLVTWENVERLLALADKYNIAIVRGYCAHFLALGGPNMRLDAPLLAPYNPLRAATLFEKFCSAHDSLKAYGEVVHGAVNVALSPLTAPIQCCYNACALLATLDKVVTHEQYMTAIAPSVQGIVSAAMLRGLHGLLELLQMPGR
ncbi:hypothetical protein TSOC_009461 [Tetrabaena socialis]|uniref:BTB domain-containing protein n=1 Tax=Tetrabaena socialis TaxID=47790 RepID=A0A2J7ZVT2_9CHLO|nr:hypothetical protein TSOC_009461 [Tetrabaena socialis]|eukprot:PNH04381.1 hypothetical protein TSOC_009461 [Tetrabaena socialis]